MPVQTLRKTLPLAVKRLASNRHCNRPDLQNSSSVPTDDPGARHRQPRLSPDGWHTARTSIPRRLSVEISRSVTGANPLRTQVQQLRPRSAVAGWNPGNVVHSQRRLPLGRRAFPSADAPCVLDSVSNCVYCFALHVLLRISLPRCRSGKLRFPHDPFAPNHFHRKPA